MRAVWLAALVAAACDFHVGQDPAVIWAVNRLHEDERAVLHDEDPTFACTAVRDAAIQLQKVPAARDDVASATATCRKVVQAFAETRLAAAAKSKAPVVVECLDVDRAIALLGALGADGGPLERRRKGLCP